MTKAKEPTAQEVEAARIEAEAEEQRLAHEELVKKQEEDERAAQEQKDKEAAEEQKRKEEEEAAEQKRKDDEEKLAKAEAKKVQYRYIDNTPFGVKLSVVERSFKGATDTITPDHGKSWEVYLNWVAAGNEPLQPGQAWA